MNPPTIVIRQGCRNPKIPPELKFCLPNEGSFFNPVASKLYPVDPMGRPSLKLL